MRSSTSPSGFRDIGHRHHAAAGHGSRGFPGGGRFSGGDMDGGHHGGGGRRRRLFDAVELKLILLHLIAGRPRHGYDLIRAIQTLSGEAYAPSPGVIYPTLTLLADMELVDEQPGEGSRKLFGITPAGTAFLETYRDETDDALAKLAVLAKRAARTDGAPIRRAMGNLKTALHNRLGGDSADAETVLNVAALIDEAASKIERLK